MRSSSASVHPRACGEQPSAAAIHVCICGSSPRVRGTGRAFGTEPSHRRFIPARAGNRLPLRSRAASRAVHPRACGEQSISFMVRRSSSGSSPRVRGTVPVLLDLLESGRFIPARAGNSAARRCRVIETPVHPRACGEQRLRGGATIDEAGSSPRVRGTAVRDREQPG